MRLDKLIDGLHIRLAQGKATRDLADLTDDSRQVTQGSLFIARTGAEADGRAFLADAVARGAAAVLCQAPLPQPVPGHVAVLNADHINQALVGELAERFFDRPSRKLRLIGVTGTNGKTTTAWIIRHLLNTVGVRCGFIGTVAIDDGTIPSSSNQSPALPTNTTPGAIEFSRLLARMVANGCGAAVAEVSSHALDQGRADALRFDAAVFTNLTGDHLDYHRTMDAYAAAKARLFTLLKPDGWAIVNADDAYSETMLAALPAEGTQVMRCHQLPPTPPSHATAPVPGPQHVAATVLHASAEGSHASFDGPWGSVQVMLPLVGPHNVTNALQAIAAAHTVSDLGRSLRHALAHCSPVPGRLEKVSNSPNPKPEPRNPNPETPTILVDYAHTHDALENVLQALRPLTAGRLILLFGCGGDRDATKRPKMAQVAQRYADVIHVTSDNPRTEDPQRIINHILAGFTSAREAERLQPPGSPTIHVEPDRAAAIRRAILDAEPHDTVLLAGKGHEDYQILGKTRHPFDDRQHAAAALTDWLTQRHTQPTPSPPAPATP